ncbi:calbindin-32-like protein, partial [Leptotrombidium deliense]
LAKLDTMEIKSSIVNKVENLMRKYREPGSGMFRALTAKEFLDIWKHYDADGRTNGFLYGQQLDQFLLDFMTSLNETEIVSAKLFFEFKERLMLAYDDNKNGKLELKELMHILPFEQPLRDLLLRQSTLKTSVEFMKIWTKYDDDHSGFVERDELKCILEDFHKITTKLKIDETKLDEYTNLFFEIFDSNKDEKLQLSEVSKMLPVEENIFKQMKLLENISNRSLNKIFDKYDLDRNGCIDAEELQIFLKDLLDVDDKEYEMSTIEDLKQTILHSCELNMDNRLQKKQLKSVLKSMAHTKSHRCFSMFAD